MSLMQSVAWMFVLDVARNRAYKAKMHRYDMYKPEQHVKF